MENDAQIVLYYDGLCNLCNRTVRFVVTHDKKKKIHLETLQSGGGIVAAQKLHLKLVNDMPGSFILYNHGKYFTKSDAVLQLVKIIGGMWKLLYAAGIIIPRAVRDTLYDFVARNRYGWFGKYNECKL